MWHRAIGSLYDALPSFRRLFLGNWTLKMQTPQSVETSAVTRLTTQRHIAEPAEAPL
jgi:hypothetical protein